ncbi:MAG TPA: 4-hydroxy-3-methylbut-2-enyl diphosphate reductase [Phycisphaerae bacterium]|jgi:4-hydroxy-3-methylbut-2-enyl diphosphate reductase|nr:4-hydroxy-3-methylbut-2-enyl diphosphate reductase [Phycisphaerae bacterium]HOB75381.1 4-hydroxy-3-methylbut-2-enyl diphosphate reductase [Phycisphaerae bacterium]HOJ55947.1 4-hydroxy-3-methylbut-2-enyl diphosphate reductase [Phycisphaerae bacterium]HOL26701.1 4-hydroxy-3-methylbut-2-enyl diphosphate reductase [Phycisphaerae bacterium]HPP20550.1 4-hydroxy-3-methylbut-2-enyl diphosphate reductase [Phycisphaerae bacterium]
MQVKLASKRGFCFGVEDAIELAEHTVRENPGRVVALGPVIHNRQVVERLEQAGLNQSADLDTVPEGTTVLIRSHGAGPETFAQAAQRGVPLVDATCVLVKRAQTVVQQLHQEGYQVVMIGDAEHPEVKGVIGYAPNVIVVDREEDLDAVLPKRGKLGIVAQTTHAPEHVAEMIGAIARRPFRELRVVNTLCLEVIRRQEAAVALCKEVDVMFVLGGLHSANTRELARLCEQEGVATYHLETWEQFKPEMVKGRKVAGITAGASTPDFIINDFAEKLQAFDAEE